MGNVVFDRHSAALEAGDVNGDGREDLVTFRAGYDELSVFSGYVNALNEPDVYRSAILELEMDDDTYGTAFGRPVNPQILALSADIANDGSDSSGALADVQVLDFDRHFLDFTEPLVLVAMAAPPCVRRIGQNTDACTTTWGKAESTGAEGEHAATFTAGVSVGVQYEASGGTGVLNTKLGSFEAKLALSRSASRVHNESYQVTKSISFETGPMEDSVVFTSIPYDTYVYTMRSTTFDTSEGSPTFHIGLPRDAVVRMATARYYNANTTDSALKIDESVFSHRVGDLDSYPTVQERDTLIADHRSQVQALRIDCPKCWRAHPDDGIGFFDGPLRSFDPFTALPGLRSDSSIGVGQGSGATEVAVELDVSNGFGRALESSAAVEVEVVIGYVLLGFEVGGASSTSTMIQRTTTTSYVGTVGSIDDDNFRDNQYRFGLFTYLQADPDSSHEFEVVNYWVEQDED